VFALSPKLTAYTPQSNPVKSVTFKSIAYTIRFISLREPLESVPVVLVRENGNAPECLMITPFF